MNSTTLEFSKFYDRIMVSCNFQKMGLGEFCRKDGSKKILITICNAIRRQYSKENKCDNKACLEQMTAGSLNCTDYPEIVGNFIKNHFLKKDIAFDVIVNEHNGSVDFNLENG